MLKKSELRNGAQVAEKFWLWKNILLGAAFFSMVSVVIFAAGFAVFSPSEAWCADNEAVALPSRFAGVSGQTGAYNTPKGAAPVRPPVRAPIRAPVTPPPQPSQYAGSTNRYYFVYGGTPPRIVCQVGKTTDIELEPGERVENFYVTDTDRWSISASWSGAVDHLVTHVLLRTFFPGVRSNLRIYTNKRAYEMELVSGLDVSHMSYVGFRYPGALEPKSEEVPTGRYRDLLLKYGLIDGDPEEKEMKARRVDGADLNFRYSIKPLGKSKPSWTPQSVYDADGRTYIVLPPNPKERPSLYIVNNNERRIIMTTALKEDLYVVDRLFDEAVLKTGGAEVSIRRIFSND